MALQISMQTDQGFIASEAYVVIARVEVSHEASLGPESVEIHKGYANIEIFKDKQARYKGLKPCGSMTAVFLVSSDTPLLTQAYAALKALPEMEGAVDV